VEKWQKKLNAIYYYWSCKRISVIGGFFMKRIALVLILVAAMVASAAAEGAVVNSKGTKALQFDVSGLIGNTSIDGVSVIMPSSASKIGIGGKYYLMDKLGLGLNLYVKGSSTPDTTVKSTFDLGLKPYAQYTLFSKGPIELYAGAYLAFGIESSKSSGTTLGVDWTGSSSTTVFGLGGTAGVEYFVLNGISLGAEYSLGANFYHSGSSGTSGSTTTTTSGSMTSDLGTGNASIFLTFYI
jgi:hypothetical protein